MLLPNYGFSLGALSENPLDQIAWAGDSTLTLDWELRLFAATHEYISRSTDDPIDTAFKGTLIKAYRLDRSILGPSQIGLEVTIGVGEIVLANNEADYDVLTFQASPLGQKVTIKCGDRRKPYATWQLLLQGFLADMTLDREQITFRARDGGYRLDRPASPNLYLGTGGIEGTTDLQGKRKPRFFGHLYNVTPPLVIPTSLIYQLNDGPVHGVDAVYVRGVALIFDADYADEFALAAASLYIGTYATCIGLGLMRIGVASTDELGEVTCDFRGDDTGNIFVETAADIVRRLLHTTELVDPDDLIVGSFDALNTAQSALIGYGIPVGSDETVAQSIAHIMASVGGWGGSRRNGRFEVRRFDSPVGTPIRYYDKKDIVDISIGTLPDTLLPPPWRVRVSYARNWTPNQTNLAGSVSDTRRAFLAEEYRYAAAEDNTVRLNFPPGQELVVNTYFRDLADASAEATRLLSLYTAARTVYIIKLFEPLYIHELGDIIFVQWPGRFDLANGKLMRVVKITEDDQDGVELTTFG